ncbi:MAG: hypothetical protein KF819_25295 [Labilithrix sp.]|nr:hypothetical protein [Labilithrix sp.]
MGGRRIAAGCVVVAVVACSADEAQPGASTDLPRGHDASWSGPCPKRADLSAPAPFLRAPDVAGDRIRVHHVTASDGSRIFWSLHDAKLALDCMVTDPRDARLAATAGACVPSARASREALTMGAGYTTSDCKTPVWGVAHEAPPPPLAGPRVKTIYENCQPVAAPPDRDFYVAGTPPSDLVVFTRAEPTDAAGEAVMSVGSDGSRVWLGEVAAFGAVVYGVGAFGWRTNGAATGVLLPELLGAFGFTAKPAGCGADGADVYRLEPEALARFPHRLASVGGTPRPLTPIAGSAFWVQRPDAHCSSRPQPGAIPCGCDDVQTDDARAFVANQGCEASDFVFVREVTVGAAVRQPSVVYGPAEARAPWPEDPGAALFDGNTGVRCAPRVARDGALRCLPLANTSDTAIDLAYYYADAACTTPLTVVGAYGFVAQWRDQRLAIYASGAEVTPTELFWRDDGACFPAAIPLGKRLAGVGKDLTTDFAVVTIGE